MVWGNGMKKKFTLLLALLLPFSAILTACSDSSNKIELTKTFSLDGFEIKTTEDYEMDTNYDQTGFNLISQKDDSINIGESCIRVFFEEGNSLYDFENTSLDEYVADYSSVALLNISDYEPINIIETKEGGYSRNVEVRMYAFIRENTYNSANINYEKDYNVLICGKMEHFFCNILFSADSLRQSEIGYSQKNLDDRFKNWLNKVETIANTIKINSVKIDKSYQDSVKSCMSTKIASSGDLIKWFRIELPANYEMHITSELMTTYLSADEEQWDSMINFVSVGTIFGVPVPNNGVERVFHYGNNNNRGFFVKFKDDLSLGYNVYLYNDQDEMFEYYLSINVNYDTELASQGFENYFEEHMLSWINSIELLDIGVIERNSI